MTTITSWQQNPQKLIDTINTLLQTGHKCFHETKNSRPREITEATLKYKKFIMITLLNGGTIPIFEGIDKIKL